MSESHSPSARRSFLLKGGAAAAAGVTTAAAAAAIGAPAAGAAGLSLVYLPVGPYRVYDSRKAEGRLNQGQTRLLKNGIGPEEFAHCYNLTVTETRGSGYLAVFPADEPWRGTSSINWTGPGQQIANNVFTNFRFDDGGIKIRCGSGSAHFVLDLVAVSALLDLSFLSDISLKSASTTNGGRPSLPKADPSIYLRTDK